MALFFIRRPIVAIVIAILTVMLGLVTIAGLSVEQYPFLAPPNIRVTATYPGASAEAVEQSVATPVEQEVNGVEADLMKREHQRRPCSWTSTSRSAIPGHANVLTGPRSRRRRGCWRITQQGVTVRSRVPAS
jgi:HAE1 family hydrophobic/amphiphilic exporter-1